LKDSSMSYSFQWKVVFQTSKNPVYWVRSRNRNPLQKSKRILPRRLTTKSINLIHAAHAKATQAIEQHIAPGYEAAYDIKNDAGHVWSSHPPAGVKSCWRIGLGMISEDDHFLCIPAIVF
jgi:hypothetical protein